MRYLVDSNILVAVFKNDDSTHTQAVRLVTHLRKENHQFLALNLVIYESTTVISHKMNMVNAKRFHERIPAFIDRIIHLDEDMEKNAWRIFLQQKKKGTSFVDCANVATIEYYKLDGILSFDTFYPKKLRIDEPKRS